MKEHGCWVWKSQEKYYLPAEEIKFISAAVGKRTKMGREKPSFYEDSGPRMLRGNWSRISYNKTDKRNLVCFSVLFFC